MTIERRTDYLWGLVKGEAYELCKGSVIEWEIASTSNSSITQSAEVKTPDIISVRTMFPGRAMTVSLYQEEINHNNVFYPRKVNWREALIGRVERVMWREDETIKGKKLFNPVLSPQSNIPILP